MESCSGTSAGLAQVCSPLVKNNFGSELLTNTLSCDCTSPADNDEKTWSSRSVGAVSSGVPIKHRGLNCPLQAYLSRFPPKLCETVVNEHVQASPNIYYPSFQPIACAVPSPYQISSFPSPALSMNVQQNHGFVQPVMIQPSPAYGVLSSCSSTPLMCYYTTPNHIRSPSQLTPIGNNSSPCFPNGQILNGRTSGLRTNNLPILSLNQKLSEYVFPQEISCSIRSTPVQLDLLSERSQNDSMKLSPGSTLSHDTVSFRTEHMFESEDNTGDNEDLYSNDIDYLEIRDDVSSNLFITFHGSANELKKLLNEQKL